MITRVLWYTHRCIKRLTPNAERIAILVLVSICLLGVIDRSVNLAT